MPGAPGGSDLTSFGIFPDLFQLTGYQLAMMDKALESVGNNG